MNGRESLLAFWQEQICPSHGSWIQRLRKFRSHPDDVDFNHLEPALAAARSQAQATDGNLLDAIAACLSQSEQLADHELAISLAERGSAAGDSTDRRDLLALLRERHEVIRQFGRFPARNRELGRPSTPTEAYFMLGAGQLHR